MKKNLKDAIKYAFEAPQPVRKKMFLRKFSEAKISNFEFMLIQAGYIRKEVWMFSAFILAFALVGAWVMKKDILWTVSSLLPFVALLAVAENAKSITCNMAELEMASRFSLKSVLFARMGAVGAVHLMLLSALILLGRMYGARTIFETGVYMLLPYLAATVSGLWVTRKFRGKEAVYGCTGFAILISGINIVVNDERIFAHQEMLFHKKVIVLFALMALTVWEYKQSIKGTEDLVWSL